MHDAKVLGLLRLNAGSIVAMDRAYNDYRQFARWTDAGVYFVTRMKDNAVYAVVDERDVPVHRNIHSDAIILLTGRRRECPHIVVWAEHERSCCSPITSTSPRPAGIYKEPDRALLQGAQAEPTGQELRPRRRTRCAQIWTALLALLPPAPLSTAGWSLSNLASMLRLNLFTYRICATGLTHRH